MQCCRSARMKSFDSNRFKYVVCIYLQACIYIKKTNKLFNHANRLYIFKFSHLTNISENGKFVLLETFEFRAEYIINRTTKTKL